MERFCHLSLPQSGSKAVLSSLGFRQVSAFAYPSTTILFHILTIHDCTMFLQASEILLAKITEGINNITSSEHE